MIPTTAPLSTRLDSGTAPSSIRTTRIGMMVGWGCCDVPNARSIVACAVSRTPSEATSFASGAAVRSGRKTASSITMVTTITNT